MMDNALEALRLYDEYEKLPNDRGGKDGPKGKAWQAFVNAKNEALNIEPIRTTQTPYGDVTGPAGAIKYVEELINDDVTSGLAESLENWKKSKTLGDVEMIVFAHFSDFFNLNREDLRTDSRLFKDLNMDELDICEVLMWAEETFDIMIMDDDVDYIATIGDLIHIIKKNNKTNRDQP